MDFSIDVSASIKDGRFDKVFAESECYFKILETAFNQVQWAVVQSENLRSKIWSVFIRANPVEYTVEGFHLGLLKKVGDGYRLGCKYKSITIDQEISEAFILSKIGIGKR